MRGVVQRPGMTQFRHDKRRRFGAGYILAIAVCCALCGCQSQPGDTIDPFLRQRVPPPGTGAAPLGVAPYGSAGAAPRFEGRGAAPVNRDWANPGNADDENLFPDENRGATRIPREELKPSANEVVRVREPSGGTATKSRGKPENKDAARLATRNDGKPTRSAAAPRGTPEAIDIMDLPPAGKKARPAASSRAQPLKQRRK